jgi:hypothetical protein
MAAWAAGIAAINATCTQQRKSAWHTGHACMRARTQRGAPGMTQTRPPAYLVGPRYRQVAQEAQPLLRHGRHSSVGIHGRLGGGQGRQQRHLRTATHKRGHTCMRARTQGGVPGLKHASQITWLASATDMFHKNPSPCSATAATPRWASMAAWAVGRAAINGTCTQQRPSAGRTGHACEQRHTEARPPDHLVRLCKRHAPQETQPLLRHGRHSPVGIQGRLGGRQGRHQRHLYIATHERRAYCTGMHASEDTRRCTRADQNTPTSSPCWPPQQPGSTKSAAPAPPRPTLPGGHPWQLGRWAGPPSTAPAHSKTRAQGTLGMHACERGRKEVHQG